MKLLKKLKLLKFKKVKYLITHKSAWWSIRNFIYTRESGSIRLILDSKWKGLETQTIRNRTFSLTALLGFNKLIGYRDLPKDFKLNPFKILRYQAKFYGYAHQANRIPYNLWLTLGLKKNIAVPFGLYFQIKRYKRGYLNSINRNSWERYAYLIKSSLNNVLKNNIIIGMNLYIQSQFFLLSDFAILI